MALVFDHEITAGVEMQKTFGIHHTIVAGGEQTRAVRLETVAFGRLRRAPVAKAHVRASNDELAHLASSQALWPSADSVQTSVPSSARPTLFSCVSISQAA